MKILLACSAGMSTSLLEQAMNKYIKEQNLDYQVDALDSATAKNVISKYDVVLLGPQVKFMESQFKKLSEGIPVGVIPMQMYGLVQGEKVVKLAQELVK